MAIKKPTAKKASPAGQSDRFGSAILTENQEKTKDSQPDYKGWGEVNGQLVWVSGWIKNNPEKGDFISLSFEPRDPR